MILCRPPTAQQKVRLTRRVNELCTFYASRGRLPELGSADTAESGLAMFLDFTLRPRHRNGTLPDDLRDRLNLIPGSLPFPPLAEDEKQPEPEYPQLSAFEQWLVRAEQYTGEHGYRPPSHDDNGLYQWVVRSRKKLMAGDLDSGYAQRLRTVLAFPDIRAYRVQTSRDGDPHRQLRQG